MVAKKISNNDTSFAVIKKRKADANIRQGYLYLLLRVLGIVFVTWVLFSFVFMIMQAKGNGMFPSVKDGDLVLAFRMQHEYESGDVVVYEINGERYIGRVVAGQYDVVMIDENGALLVNGAEQSGEIMYPTYPKEGLTYPLNISDNQVFVLGDYRTQTTDSRDFGLISTDDVKGKVITVLRRRGL